MFTLKTLKYFLIASVILAQPVFAEKKKNSPSIMTQEISKTVEASMDDPVKQSKFPDIIYNIVSASKKQSKESKDALFAVDIKTIANDEEKAVILFARGVSLFKTNPTSSSDEFDAAKKLLPADSPLSSLISIYYGRSSLNTKNSKQILAKLKMLAKSPIGKSSLWRSEQFTLLIEIMMLLKQDDLLAKTWGEMENRVKPALRDDDLTLKVSQYLEKLDLTRKRHLIPVIESMASAYPHSETGRWAFQKLQKLQCNTALKYVYPLNLLSRLASNTNLDEGLKQFIIEVTKGPVRDSAGKTKIFDEAERLNYLFQIRFWNEARRIVEVQIESLKTAQSAERKVKYSKALSLLGQLQIKQGEFELAVRTWSLYVEMFGEDVDARFALENIADSLTRLKSYGEAAKIYETLGKSPTSDPVLKWHHFWNVYLSGDYNSAIKILDIPGYVPLRDRGIEGGLDYWRAKILEKMRLNAESDAFYRKVLAENGENFYALAAVARHSTLKDNSSLDSFFTKGFSADVNHSNIQVKQGNSKDGPVSNGVELKPENIAESDSAFKRVDNPSEMRTVVAMKKWGQIQIGRRLLRTMPTIHQRNGTSSWVESFRLATDLKDYAYGLKAPSMPDASLKNLPSEINQLEMHMSQNNADWKLLYPYAFREHVEKLSSAAEVDPFLLLSLMKAESVFDVDARSGVGARGLMQIMPFTAVRIARMMQDGNFELSDLHQPEVNIGYAAYYLKKLTDYYKGNVLLAVAAYNGGPTSVDRWISHYGHLELDEFIESIPFKETRKYVKSVFKNYNNYRYIWQQSTAIVSLPTVPSSTSGDEIF